MKKIGIFVGFLTLLLVLACSENRAEQRQNQPIRIEQRRSFQLPEIPVMITDPEQRLIYVVNHYWDHFDFKDTAYIHLPDITEQAAVNYMDLLQRVKEPEVEPALARLMEQATVEPKMVTYFWELLKEYWHNPNSPMKNEGLFIQLCRTVEGMPKADEAMRSRAAFLRKMAEKNRVGEPAADFVYTLATGRQGNLYGIKADYTLIFFYNPDCEMCTEVKRAMKQSPMLEELCTSGRLKVLTMYPDEDPALWKYYLPEMSHLWINAYDKEQVLNREMLYDLSSIPSFYLLDKQKRVLLKDADWNQVLRYFQKINR